MQGSQRAAGDPSIEPSPARICNLTRLSASDILAMFYLSFRCRRVWDRVFSALTSDVDRGDESSEYGQGLGRAAREISTTHEGEATNSSQT